MGAAGLGRDRKCRHQNAPTVGGDVGEAFVLGTRCFFAREADGHFRAWCDQYSRAVTNSDSEDALIECDPLEQIGEATPCLVFDVAVETGLDRVEDKPGASLDVGAGPLFDNTASKGRYDQCDDQGNGKAEEPISQ